MRQLRASQDPAPRIARSGLTLAGATVATQGARLVRNVILARLLAPDQFGLMALLLAVSSLFEAISDVGLRQSVIQNKRGDTDAFLNVAWWLGALRGVGLFLLGFMIAPWVGSFYEDASLALLLRFAFLSVLFAGLTSPKLFVLERRLRFDRYVLVFHGSQLGGTLVSLAAVVVLQNVWALLIGFVSEAVLRCIVSFIVCPVKVRLHFEGHALRELLLFARRMIGLPVLTFVIRQADVFVLGKVCTKNELGMYALALALAYMPVSLFSRIIEPLMLPVLSPLQDAPATLRRAATSMTRAILAFGMPLVVYLTVFSQPLLSVTYGKAYGEMWTAFGLLCVYLLVWTGGAVITMTYMALGRPDLHRRYAGIRAVAVAALMYPATLKYGPVGAAGTLLVAFTIAIFLQLLNLARLIDMPVRHYLASMWPGLGLAGMLAIPALVVRLCWQGSDLWKVLLGAATCATVWAITILQMRGRNGARSRDFFGLTALTHL
ncbi:MAG TPA: oligosaccharide flippase family protein [Phycisphaerae bacterium]|nr:oligosaccharide flippase family protein [Phycisphaerae bacterium]